MKIKTLTLLGALAGAAMAMAPSISHAQSRMAYTLTGTTMHSGPHYSYPQITYVPQRDTIQVYGCLSDWSWCDVRWRGERGWIDADHLAVYRGYYGNDYSIWHASGYNLGWPIVSFALTSYWNDHYRHRPWYRQQDHWLRHRPPVQHRPQRPGRPHDWNGDGRPDHRPGVGRPPNRDWDRGRDGNRNDRPNVPRPVITQPNRPTPPVRPTDPRPPVARPVPAPTPVKPAPIQGPRPIQQIQQRTQETRPATPPAMRQGPAAGTHQAGPRHGGEGRGDRGGRGNREPRQQER